MGSQLGYNFAFKANTKMFAGVQSENLDVKPRIKSSLKKSLRGNTENIITGHDITFAISGIVEKNEAGATTLDNDEILALALKKGDEAVVSFVWERGALGAYKGTAVIAGYSESTDSENEATYSLNLTVQGELTLVTPAV